jgi:hypothetical protein
MAIPGRPAPAGIMPGSKKNPEIAGKRGTRRMTKIGITRFGSVLTGAAVLFGLQQGLNISFYLALPAALLAYIAVKLTLGFMLGAGKEAEK